MDKIQNQRGNAILTTPFIVMLSIFIITILFTTIINLIMPYIWYQKLSNLSLKYMFIIENYGYLTNFEKENLLLDLKNEGFDITNVEVLSTDIYKPYGEPIFLNLSYKYRVRLPNIINNFNVKYDNKEIEMVVRKNGVSKV